MRREGAECIPRTPGNNEVVFPSTATLSLKGIRNRIFQHTEELSTMTLLWFCTGN